MKKLLYINGLMALMAAGVIGCSDPKKLKEDYPEGEKGTARAIVGDHDNLNDPRPAPIGDTAKTEEQQDQFGEHNVENVDSVARGLK